MAWSKRVQEKADFNLDKPIIKRLSMWDVECNFDPDVRSNTFTICVQMQVLYPRTALCVLLIRPNANFS